jgi:hypothetical protein
VENDKLNQLKLAYRKENLELLWMLTPYSFHECSCFLLFSFFDKLGILISRLLTTKNESL